MFIDHKTLIHEFNAVLPNVYEIRMTLYMDYDTIVCWSILYT